MVFSCEGNNLNSHNIYRKINNLWTQTQTLSYFAPISIVNWNNNILVIGGRDNLTSDTYVYQLGGNILF